MGVKEKWNMWLPVLLMVVFAFTRWPGLGEDEPEETLGRAYITPPPELTAGHRDEAAIAAQTWPEPVNEALRAGFTTSVSGAETAGP